MNPFSRDDWKKAARKQMTQPGEFSVNWLIGGILVAIVVVALILGQ